MFTVNEAAVPPPKPAWQEIKKFREWWWQSSVLGAMDSVLRAKIFMAFEQLSWTAHTEEEYILFLLLRICIETKIELGSAPFEIQSEWCVDLAQIITQLGPFPLLKLYVTHESLGLKPLLISLVQQSPHLQVLHVNQWALSNDFMTALGSHCRLLTEFSIPHMQPQVFMSDEALFACFFDGLGSEAVQRCWREGMRPPLSFYRLKIVDVLYWKQTKRFIQMLAHFYPGVRLRDIDVHFLEEESKGLASPFLEVEAKVPVMGVTIRLGDTQWERLSGFVKSAPYLRELRVLADGTVDGGVFEREAKIEEAGARLEKLVSQMRCFESLAVRHDSLSSVVGVFGPALKARGECVASLHLCCETTRMDACAVFQMVNLCPRLCVLVLTLPLGEAQAPRGGRTVLQPCQALHTLAVLNSGWAALPEHPCPCPGPCQVVQQVLEAAHNLKTLGLSCTMAMKDNLSSLSSDSLRLLYLQFASQPETPSDLINFLRPLVPNFPRLLTLSLDEKYAEFPLEALAPMLNTGIDVTKWVPEFLHPSKWEFPSESMNIFNF
ncbi:hypothetical protein GWK47_046499 [Chionoecetes opilio]|uniref:Uncharacterized protein n=1 Tax=Chionoecetes opilio TaxID=41210 RepID=A0A8J5CUU3_CHIOP|nr:hypothetical protein GWK47_046499 [Chionoecetes opilio]